MREERFSFLASPRLAAAARCCIRKGGLVVQKKSMGIWTGCGQLSRSREEIKKGRMAIVKNPVVRCLAAGGGAQIGLVFSPRTGGKKTLVDLAACRNHKKGGGGEEEEDWGLVVVFREVE
jgi:hypothetical protein